MSNFQIKLIFFALFLFSIFLFFPGVTFSGCCCPPCHSECCEEWCDTCRREYNATSTGCEPAGPNIYKRSRQTEGCCGLGCTCKCVLCEAVGICEDCGSWQIATRVISGENICHQGTCEATRWGWVKPECKACVNCLKAPQNPRYYDNALYPLNPYQPEPSKDKDNIYLPVKLYWDNVEGWIEGWRLPEPKVVKKNNGERCEISLGAGMDLADCQVGCKNECWGKMEEEWKGPEKNPASKWNIGEPVTAEERAEKEVEKEIEYRDYLPKCIRDCEKQCIEDHKTSAGGICPYVPGTVFHCDPPVDYIKSYIIEIEGNMRDPETLKKIAVLEREIELIERFFPETPAAPVKITQNEDELRKIKEEELEVNFFGAALDKSEFIPPAAGFFKSNRTYKWKVRACIREYKSYKEYEDAGGETCGPWSEEWQFKTNPAPEPTLPYDPDWAGEKEDYPAGWNISGMAKEIPKWEIRFLRWAEINDKEFEDEKKAEGERCRSCSYCSNPEKTEKETGSYLETSIMEGEKSEAQIKKYCRANYCLTILSRQEGEKGISQLYCRPLTHNVVFAYRYSDAEEEKCHPQLKIGEKCQPKVVSPFPTGWPKEAPYFPPPQFSNHKYNYFTKLTSYVWQVDACVEISAEKCTDWSQKWRFSVEDFSLKKPEGVSPPDATEPEVGLPVTIAWSEIEGAMSHRYEISGIGSGKVSTSDITLDYPQLKLNTVYRWRADPCWGYEAEPAKCENNWSDLFTFKTTGRPPKEETMKPAGLDPPAPIPVTFEWEAVPGAKSYVFILSGWVGMGIDELLNRIVEKKPKLSLDYPNLYQNTPYAWEVATCARPTGVLCGPYSPPKVFQTFKLSTPDNPNPPDGGQFVAGKRNYYLSWDKVPYARFYHYKVEYVEVSPEEKEPENCPTGLIVPEPQIIITPQEMIIPKNVTPSPQSEYISLKCLGKYQWSVKACLDQICLSPSSASDWSGPWHFELVAAPPPEPGPAGLVPCGRRTDDPQTPWDETKPCEIKHLFLLLRNIIAFVVEWLVPISLVVLTVATGIVFYLSKGAPGIVIDVKRIWQAAGIGYGIILLAWLIINLFLILLGYQVGIFGRWWQINL